METIGTRSLLFMQQGLAWLSGSSVNKPAIPAPRRQRLFHSASPFLASGRNDPRLNPLSSAGELLRHCTWRRSHGDGRKSGHHHGKWPFEPHQLCCTPSDSPRFPGNAAAPNIQSDRRRGYLMCGDSALNHFLRSYQPIEALELAACICDTSYLPSKRESCVLVPHVQHRTP